MSDKTFVVNLVSSYKNYKMLTPKKKVEFVDGVARVEFDSEAEAASFVKNIESNSALKPYVRVASEAKANEVAKANVKAAATGGIKIGAQTSEVASQQPKLQNWTIAPTQAQVFNEDKSE